MDKIILGLLMLRNMTIYEIRTSIRNNFKPMASDSMGSIQAAIKKMLSQEMITCREKSEKGVKKKVYTISTSGRDTLRKWLQMPMEPKKNKNMELSKLFFMGMVHQSGRASLINEYIVSLKKEQRYLSAIAERSQDIEATTETYMQDQKAKPRFNADDKALNTAIEDIVEYQLLTLEYANAQIAFEIEWYEKLLVKMQSHNTTTL